MIMIYEAEIEQTVMGKLFIEADNLEQAKQVAERCVQEAQNLVDVDLTRFGAMNLGNLDKKTKDKIYQMLYEYRVLTQAAQLNIARGHTSYDGLECYQSVLDAKAANDIFEVIKELKLKTIEDWYYDLIDDTEETMDLMKETIAERKSNA